MSNVIDFGTRRPTTERRDEHRRRVRREALLRFNNGHGAFEASVRNQSRNGACLDMGDTTGVPNRFHLTVSSMPVGDAFVKWRSETRLGLRLEGEFPEGVRLPSLIGE